MEKGSDLKLLGGGLTRCAATGALALAAVIALLLCLSHPLPAQAQSPGNLTTTAFDDVIIAGASCINGTWTSMTAATNGYDIMVRPVTADFSTFYQRSTWHTESLSHAATSKSICGISTPSAETIYMLLVRGKGPTLDRTCHFFGGEANTGCSHWSVALVTVGPSAASAPSRPTRLTAAVADPKYPRWHPAGTKTITVRWNAVSGATHYKLQWYGMFPDKQYWVGENHNWVPREYVRTTGTVMPEPSWL